MNEMPGITSNHRNFRNPELITASEIAMWPEQRSRDAQETFPQLIRKLLVELPEAKQLSIRIGDSISIGGFDGTAVIEERTKILPAGRLRFEFGTSKDIKRKATDDLKKRNGAAIPDEVFVFITPRRWPGKDDWAKDWSEQSQFREVIALDADDIETWLDISPNTHIWISEHLGRHPKEAISLEKWWRDFSTSTKPTLPAPLFLTGRERQATSLIDLLTKNPRTITIASASELDSLGFIQSTLSSNYNEVYPILVKSQQAWEHLSNCIGSGVLIPQFSSPTISQALQNGWHVIQLLGYSRLSSKAPDIRLPLLRRSDTAKVLQAVGLKRHTADACAVLARRSLPAMVRRLSLSRVTELPDWATDPTAEILSRLMLIGRWKNCAEDRQILLKITGVSENTLDSAISDAQLRDDPAITRSGDVWTISSPEELLTALADKVPDRISDLWFDLAIDVLPGTAKTEILPLANLANTYGKPTHCDSSSELRQGVMESLAALSVVKRQRDSYNPLFSIPKRVVQGLLSSAISEMESCTWERIADLLPLLAETDPEQFLLLLEKDLSKVSPTVATLFHTPTEDRSPNISSNQHHLLWALEILSYCPDYWLKVVQVLSKLDLFNHLEQSSNTPSNTLRVMIACLLIDSQAEVTQLIELLNVCYQINFEMAWKVSKELYESQTPFLIPPHPQYREWERNYEGNISVDRLRMFRSKLIELILRWVPKQPNNIPWLITILPNTGLENAMKIRDFLVRLSYKDTLNEHTRVAIYQQCQFQLLRHKHFKSASWSMSEEQRDIIHSIADSYRPECIALRFAHLFMDDFLLWQDEYNSLRRSAIDTIMKNEDRYAQLEKLVAFEVNPSFVGSSLSFHADQTTIQVVLRWLASENTSLVESAQSYFSVLTAQQDHAFATNILETITDDTLALKLALLLPQKAGFWAVIENYPTLHDQYWKNVHPTLIRTEDASFAIGKLMAYGRPYAGIEVAMASIMRTSKSSTSTPLNPTQIVNLLDAAKDSQPSNSERNVISTFTLEQLLSYLDQFPEFREDVLRFEFFFQRILQTSERELKLHERLDSDPQFFSFLIEKVFLADNSHTDSPPESIDLNEMCFDTLMSWKGWPGKIDSDSFDAQSLINWVESSRELLLTCDISIMGEQKIGEALSRVPAKEGEIWPPEVVRNLLETASTDELARGFVIGVSNSRGITVRSLDEGGAQERELAAKFAAIADEAQKRWPKTAAVFRELADDYLWEADREDRKAQQHQDFR